MHQRRQPPGETPNDGDHETEGRSASGREPVAGLDRRRVRAAGEREDPDREATLLPLNRFPAKTGRFKNPYIGAILAQFKLLR